jgi:hypothetical protein
VKHRGNEVVDFIVVGYQIRGDEDSGNGNYGKN